MNISKSESYNLSPDEYLKRFQKPHSLISGNGKEENYESQISFLEDEILKVYNGNPESKLEREKAVNEMTIIVERWMQDIFNEWKADKKNDTQQYKLITFQTLKELGYGIKVFGSVSLWTNSFDGDIDIICVVPEFFSRENHFYSTLLSQLKNHHNISEVYSIPDASVPLIKLCCNSFQIDLLNARIPMALMKENLHLFDGEMSYGLIFVNEKQLRSINGYRTSIYLQKNIKNYRNYQVVLKAIKMWAMNKGIYYQIYGYLGGAALSIMLAKICQLYPNYSPLQLLDRFFFIYANWVWTLPVMIENCNVDEKVEGGMVIFTPMEPHMNAAHYVSRITCHITRKYLRLASKMIQDINKKKKSWKDLFKPVDFFNSYGNFIEISVMGQKYEEFIVWKGNIESKLRKFVKYLQNQIQSLQLIQIHPYPRHFPSKHSQYKHCYKYYLGMKCQSNPNLNDYCQIDITPGVRQFLELLETYQGIDKVPKELNIGFAFVQRRDLDPDVLNGLRSY